MRDSSLISVLSEFRHSVLPRAQNAPLHPHEVTFALNSFEYLKDIDRNLQSTGELNRFADLINAIDRPKPQFSEPDTIIRRVGFGPDGLLLELRNCPEVLEPLGQIIKGWGLQEAIAVDDDKLPVLRIWRQGEFYYWDTPFPGPHMDFKKPNRSPKDVASDIHYYLDQIFEFTSRSHLFLHAAAVEVSGRLILFPGTHKTGKSTLSLALAARGHRLWADDRIAIDARSGSVFALGSGPAMRKPLPREPGSWRSKLLLQRNRGLEGNEFAYLDLPSQHFAPLGESGRVTNVVVLRRSEYPIERSQQRLSAAETIKALVPRHYTTHVAASSVLSCLANIAETCPSYALDYSHTNDAVEAVENLVNESAC